MPRTLADLSDEGKTELALALLLWKDFKAAGRFDAKLLLQTYELCDMLGVRKEYEYLATNLPPFKITGGV